MNNNELSHETISPIISIPAAFVISFLLICFLGYSFFPAMIVNPLIPIIVYTYILYPLCKFNLNIKKAYPNGTKDFLLRFIIAHITIGLPLHILLAFGK